jgi:hypothetical protein
MNEEPQRELNAGHDPDEPMQGVNIKLIYSLIGLAMIAAIAIAIFIVLPFYHRR